MPSFTVSIPGLVTALAERYGRGRTKSDGFEAVALAYLTRFADDRVVRLAVGALQESGLIDPCRLAEADPVTVEESIRSAGARVLVKLAGPLQRLAGWVVKSIPVDDEGRLDVEAASSTEALRETLRAIRGIGPATADAILLEGLGRPAYPVDRATYRILVRHGWLDSTADYDEARSVVEGGFADVGTLLQVSAWFERVGRDACKASVAHCERCPLQEFLPDGGAREVS